MMKTYSDPILRGVTLVIWVVAIMTILFIVWDDVENILQVQVQGPTSTKQIFTNILNGRLSGNFTLRLHQKVPSYLPNDLHRSTGIPSTSTSYQMYHPRHNINTTAMKAMQNYRQKHIRHICRNYYNITPLNLEYNPEYALELLNTRLRWTYFNDDFMFMVSFIYKIGSSNWKQVFQRLFDKSSYEFRDRQRDPLWTLASRRFPKSHTQLVNRLRNFTKVIFVRHPLSRVLSAYQDKFVNLPTAWYKQKARLILQRERGAKYGKKRKPDVTFSEYADFITDEGLGFLSQDNHWSSIVERYRPCENYFDFIGHLENLEEDMNYLFQLLKIDGIVNYQRSKNPTHSSSKSLLKEYYSQLSDELFHKIIQKYEDDFRVFGYHIPQNASDF